MIEETITATVALISSLLNILTPVFPIPENPAPPIVVLGARVNTDCTPPEILTTRLDKAVKVANSFKQSSIYVTGGKTSKCAKTESRVMKEKLKQQHVTNKIIEENQARTTVENAKYVRKLIPNENNILLVTDNTQMGRALTIFKNEGFDPIPETA